MPNIYSWEIRQLECHAIYNGHENVVFNIRWGRFAKNEAGITAYLIGTQRINVDTSSAFTPFDNLQFQQVCVWLENELGASRIAEINSELDKQIENQINPPIVAPSLPWEN